jgi:hypothetical protein
VRAGVSDGDGGAAGIDEVAVVHDASSVVGAGGEPVVIEDPEMTVGVAGLTAPMVEAVYGRPCTRHKKLKINPGPMCSTACRAEWEA